MSAKPPCMACVVRDNPHGKAPPEMAYLVGVIDAERVGTGPVVAALCPAHRREHDEIRAFHDRIAATTTPTEPS